MARAPMPIESPPVSAKTESPKVERKRKAEEPPRVVGAAAVLASNVAFETSALDEVLPSEGFEVIAAPAEKTEGVGP